MRYQPSLLFVLSTLVHFHQLDHPTEKKENSKKTKSIYPAGKRLNKYFVYWCMHCMFIAVLLSAAPLTT